MVTTFDENRQFFDSQNLMDSLKVTISIFVHRNTLKLQAPKFYFCAFCAFLRPYQNLRIETNFGSSQADPAQGIILLFLIRSTCAR